MTHITLVRGLVVALAITGVSQELVAQRDVHAPLVLAVPWSARSLGLGGATAGSRDFDAAAINPALIGNNSSLGLAFGRLKSGVSTGAFGMQSSIGTFAWSVSGAVLTTSPALTELSPNPLRLEESLDGQGASHAVSMGVATVFKGFRVGASTSVMEERVNLERAAAAALSLGVAREALFGRISFGAALQNLGPDLRFGDRDVPLPTRLGLGFSGAGLPLGAWWDLSAQGGVSVRRDGEWGGSLGAELAWVPIEGVSFAARGGVRRPELDEQGNLTAGLGASFDRVALDLAWEQMRTAGAWRVGFRLR